MNMNLNAIRNGVSLPNMFAKLPRIPVASAVSGLIVAALILMTPNPWFEAFIGGQWYTFDPASDSPGGRIVVARGRDAADVAIYNQYGPLLLPTGMEVIVERAD